MSATTNDEPGDATIVKAAIHPPIGIARIGNSADEYFIGPEVPDPLPAPPGFYRDPTGAIKRQAARFRVYGLDAAGRAVAELTLDNAEIEWAVTLANKKAAWYQFQIALDCPDAASAPESFLRNMAIADRSALAIEPGERNIAGRSVQGPPHAFDSGRFMGKAVYLGEVRTDDAGRLIVLGGRGKSSSFTGARAITFANNEGWHDDVADGPVTAVVRYQGKALRVDPAWVVVAPPTYAPHQKSVRSMWDLMRDLFVSQGTLAAPDKPSFTRDIQPIFERLSRMQWVNAGYAAQFGWKGSTPFGDAEWMKKLASPAKEHKEWRQTLYNQFRQFDRDGWAQSPWPWLYGDAMSIPALHIPDQNVALSNLQLKMLAQWAQGDFIADYDPAAQPPRAIGQVPLAEQPDTLTRAAMEFCLADAFHPGCEMTWPMRQPTMYMAPFRLAHQPKGWVEPDYGGILTPDSFPDTCGAQGPGGLSRWMAVPWQTDTASCRSGYDKTYDPYVPTFWPARVPNQVLTKASYETVRNESLPMGERLAAFARRAAWIRPLGNTSHEDQLNNMIANIAQMGIVEVREGVAGCADFPATMEVEQLPPPPPPVPGVERMAVAHREVPEEFEDVDLTQTEKVRHLRRVRHERDR